RSSDLALVSFLVGHQHRVMDARATGDPGEHLGGVGQLRHPPGADEAGRLDALQAGGREPVDQFDLVGAGDHRLLVLQPVARADLDDAYVAGQGGAHVSAPASARATSTVSASTKSPACAWIAATVPARGAFRLSSIFIASITITSWPASTVSPALALTTTTRPGIGATTLSAPAPAVPASCRYIATGCSRRRHSPSCTSSSRPWSNTRNRRARPLRRRPSSAPSNRAPATVCLAPSYSTWYSPPLPCA